jgi:single-strand DNA-binding protein
MASFCKIILMGNLTRDPEVRSTAGGMSICKLSLAYSRSYKTQDGSSKEEVAYIDVDAFGRQADVLGQYLSKGMPILVEGRLRQDNWEKNGEKRSKLVVVLESFQFVGSKRDGSAEAGQHASGPAGFAGHEHREAVVAGPAHDANDDDVPF